MSQNWKIYNPMRKMIKKRVLNDEWVKDIEKKNDRIHRILKAIGYERPEEIMSLDDYGFDKFEKVLSRNSIKKLRKKNSLLWDYLQTMKDYFDEVRLAYRISEECEEKLEDIEDGKR